MERLKYCHSLYHNLWEKLVLEAKTRITGDMKGRRLRIYIPVDIAIDSAFPFKNGDLVKIRIDRDNRRLVIEQVEEQ